MDSFPLIYCINLIEREDRYVHMKNEFERIGLKNVKFYRPRRDPEGGKRGCFISHQTCLRNAYSKGVPYVLIFEDDLIFQNNYLEGFEQAINFIHNNENWELLRLGFTPILYEEKIDHGIWKSKVFTTSAYLASRSFMEKFKDVPYPNEHLDVYWLYHYSSLSLEKNIVIQAGFRSDNDWGHPIIQHLFQNVLNYEKLQIYGIPLLRISRYFPRFLISICLFVIEQMRYL
jgi:GR25 family glycosyltransferase involved in LPS biosynthesis